MVGGWSSSCQLLLLLLLVLVLDRMTDNIAVDRIYCGDLTNLKHPVAPIIRSDFLSYSRKMQ